MSINAELQADATPDTPLCPICHHVLVSALTPVHNAIDWWGAEYCWLCTDYAAHGAQPGTAALWRDWEITGDPFTLAEARAMELRIPWEVSDADET